MKDVDDDEFFDDTEETVVIESDDDDMDPKEEAFMKGYNEADDIDELFEEKEEDK